MEYMKFHSAHVLQWFIQEAFLITLYLHVIIFEHFSIKTSFHLEEAAALSAS